MSDSDGFETKGVRKIKKGTQLPSFLLAKERVDQRSAVGVSKYTPCIGANPARIVDSPGLCFARPPSLPQAVKRVKGFEHPRFQTHRYGKSRQIFNELSTNELPIAIGMNQ